MTDFILPALPSNYPKCDSLDKHGKICGGTILADYNIDDYGEFKGMIWSCEKCGKTT